MKKIIICILSIFCSYQIVRANDCNYFNCIIFIDGELASPSSLTNEYILIKKPESKVLDSVKFDYAFGTMLFSDDDLKKLHSISESDTLSAVFNYIELRPLQRTYDYKIEMDPSWPNQSFIIIKIYNYGNAVNKGIFPQTSGYGVEISNAVYKTNIPRL